MTLRTDVSVLYVDPRGPYPKLVTDWWDEKRDARNYAGPNPVVAHPPCARWCRLAKFVAYRSGGRLSVGEDGGCFRSALSAVETYGGILEHPAWSLAWAASDLTAPPARGWHRDLLRGGWCCEVAQSAYGHRARKLTWLYYVGSAPPPAADWSKPRGTMMVSYCSQRGDGTYFRNNARRMPPKEGSRTPVAFAEWLIELASQARRTVAA